ncbi:transglutaminase TgpA family protein [Halioxenophilus aromaticivorans]
MQLNKTPLAWLLLSVFAVVIPHARHLSVWVILAVCLIITWRVQIFRGRWSIPKRWTKLILVSGSILGLKLLYHSLLGLEPMVALLITSMVLKLLEMYRQKDAMAVVLLCFFTTAAQFLFGQTALDFFYGLFCSLLLLATLVSLNRNGSRQTQNNLAVGLRLAIQCLPVMLFLFFFFPRIGSLWSVPLPQNTAKTGISNVISPGDISRLAQDGGKAFTATFNNTIPTNEQLYWRGLVMSEFDGRQWSLNRWSSASAGGIVKWQGQSIKGRAMDWYNRAQRESKPIEYQIILEPTQQQWLYALPLADLTLGASGTTRDFTTIYHTPIAKRLVYRVESTLSYKIEPQQLPSWFRQRNLSLPEGYNSKTVAMAQKWRAEGARPGQIIDRFLSMITRDYTYTLEAPLLARDSVDDFLWNTKAGYCEHYASAFVVFMRAAGIPARVVAGYQGGEKIEDFIQVSQADAHAWAEVWLEGEGWKRVDPTAAIAPERVRSGVRAVFDRSVRNPLSMEAYRHIDLLNRLRLQIDVFNYRWQTFVLNYNSDRQLSLVQKIFGAKNLWQMAFMVSSVIVLCVAIFVLLAYLKQRPNALAPEIKAIRRLEKKIAKLGLVRRPGETVSQFLTRAGHRLPRQAKSLQEILLNFEKVTYQNQPQHLTALKTQIEQFKAR